MPAVTVAATARLTRSGRIQVVRTAGANDVRHQGQRNDDLRRITAAPREFTSCFVDFLLGRITRHPR